MLETCNIELSSLFPDFCTITYALQNFDNDELVTYLCQHEVLQADYYVENLERVSLEMIKRHTTILNQNGQLQLLNGSMDLLLAKVSECPDGFQIIKYLLCDCKLQVPTSDCTAVLNGAIKSKHTHFVSYLLSLNIRFNASALVTIARCSMFGIDLFKQAYCQIAPLPDMDHIELIRDMLKTTNGEAIDYLFSQCKNPQLLLDARYKFGVSHSEEEFNHFAVLYKYLGDNLLSFRNNCNCLRSM